METVVETPNVIHFEIEFGLVRHATTFAEFKASSAWASEIERKGKVVKFTCTIPMDSYSWVEEGPKEALFQVVLAVKENVEYHGRTDRHAPVVRYTKMIDGIPRVLRCRRSSVCY